MIETKLKREIGLFGLTANIVNIVIGAGIFVLPAIVAAGLGNATIIAYIFCGVLIMLIMLCFAEVGGQITDTGGVYIYIEKTFGPYAGFITAMLFLFSNITGTAAVANAVIDVILKLFPQIQFSGIRVLFFFLLFSGLAYPNIMGLKKGVGIVKVITLLKLMPLLLLILIGFKDISISNLLWEETPSLHQIGATSLILFFAFTGAGSALSVSGEVTNPRKNIPKAILISIFFVTVFYILIQTVAQGVLGPLLAQSTDNPLGQVANVIIGPIGFTLLTIGAGVSMFGNISSKVLSSPRVLFATSESLVIPIKKLAAIHPKFGTPYVSIIVYAVLCFVFSSAVGFQQLAIISSASALLIAFGVSVAVIKLRRSKESGTTNTSFRIPGGYTVPILSSMAILWFLSNLSLTKIVAVLISIMVLSVIYFLMNRGNKNDFSRK